MRAADARLMAARARRCGRAAAARRRCPAWLGRHGCCLLVSAASAAAPAGAARDRIVGGAGDGADQFLVGRVGREDAVVAAEPQHDDAVGDGAHVLHVVADHDDAEAAVAHALDQVEHLGGLRHAERGGRLVEHDDLRIEQQRAGDRHGLALAAGERGDRLAHARECAPTSSLSSVQARISIDTSSSRSGLSSWPRNMLATTSRFSHSARSWKTVAMPSVERGARIGEGHRLAVELIVPDARLMHAGQDLDQRRFAGAVVADQRHDLAGMDVEIDVGERRDRAEILGDAAQAEHQLRPAEASCVEVSVMLRHAVPMCRKLASGRRDGGRTTPCTVYWMMPSFLQPSA